MGGRDSPSPGRWGWRPCWIPGRWVCWTAETPPSSARGRWNRYGARRVILATGAKENALAFRGWTLPGAMTAGAAQTFSNVHGTLVGEHILMVGSGNVGLIVSYQLMQVGAEIRALLEAAPSGALARILGGFLLKLAGRAF